MKDLECLAKNFGFHSIWEQRIHQEFLNLVVRGNKLEKGQVDQRKLLLNLSKNEVQR